MKLPNTCVNIGVSVIFINKQKGNLNSNLDLSNPVIFSKSVEYIIIDPQSAIIEQVVSTAKITS